MDCAENDGKRGKSIRFLGHNGLSPDVIRSKIIVDDKLEGSLKQLAKDLISPMRSHQALLNWLQCCLIQKTVPGTGDKYPTITEKLKFPEALNSRNFSSWLRRPISQDRKVAFRDWIVLDLIPAATHNAIEYGSEVEVNPEPVLDKFRKTLDVFNDADEIEGHIERAAFDIRTFLMPSAPLMKQINIEFKNLKTTEKALRELAERLKWVKVARNYREPHLAEWKNNVRKVARGTAPFHRAVFVLHSQLLKVFRAQHNTAPIIASLLDLEGVWSRPITPKSVEKVIENDYSILLAD